MVRPFWRVRVHVCEDRYQSDNFDVLCLQVIDVRIRPVLMGGHPAANRAVPCA
jgi:hypothetical protein